MKLISKPRRGGKTTELIKLSAETGAYIVCHSKQEAHRVQAVATRQGVNIPFPLSYGEFVNRDYCGRGVSGLLIDNVEALLEYMALSPVVAATITEDDDYGVFEEMDSYHNPTDRGVRELI